MIAAAEMIGSSFEPWATRVGSTSNSTQEAYCRRGIRTSGAGAPAFEKRNAAAMPVTLRGRAIELPADEPSLFLSAGRGRHVVQT